MKKYCHSCVIGRGIASWRRGAILGNTFDMVRKRCLVDWSFCAKLVRDALFFYSGFSDGGSNSSSSDDLSLSVQFLSARVRFCFVA